MRLFDTKPASCWEETLPIGNGSLGAMIWGGEQEEKLGLNQDSLWSGCERDKNNPGAREYLEPARRLIEAEKYAEAEELIAEHMLGEYGETYLPLGDLHVSFLHGEAREYERILDIANAIATVSYRADDVTYRREYFASYPAGAIAMRFSCDRPMLDLSVSFHSQLHHTVTATPGGLFVEGRCPEHVDPSYVGSVTPVIQGERGIPFHAEFRLLHTDGCVDVREGALHVSEASEAVFLFTAVKPAKSDASMGYEALKAQHIDDYRRLYDRVELFLGEQLPLPTFERLQRLRAGEEDNGLYALFFQYGRYLLISSSREGGLPANLQGIWNWHLRAPWSSNWTTNINTEMNYWPALSCNLRECLAPYVEFVGRLCENGNRTAQVHYGCRGFVQHHNADGWFSTNPMGIPYGDTKGMPASVTWSFWPMGAAWLMSEVLRYTEYHPDPAFLRETVYPLLRESTLFLVDWLYEYEGEYVTCPSTSPENRFRTTDGRKASAAMSSAMDLALIREVFGNFRRVCGILAVEDELLPEIEERLERLTPFRTGSQGQLLEWHRELEEDEPGHRHLSHLYGLFPSELFEGDEALTEACRVSLRERLAHGGGHTGWSCAWIINLFAVLGDGENAYRYLRSLLTRAVHDNLWGDHPPFQIDANFGGTAAIANMLVQDRGGQVKLLPALPKEFADGYVKGLRIKGGKTVDIAWSQGSVTQYRIYEEMPVDQ